MIYGLYNQGVKCNDCGMCSHKKCQAIIPHTCGMQTQEKHGRISLNYNAKKQKENEWMINIEGDNTEQSNKQYHNYNNMSC